MQRRISTKRIIIDLLSIKEQVAEHFKNNIKYQDLINYILTDKKLSDEDSYLPTFKEMEKDSGIKVYHIRKQLTEIYDILFDSEQGHVFKFPKNEIWFSANNGKKHIGFKCHNVTYLPRIGENIELPFVYSKLDGDYFYVSDVRHRFIDHKQIIIIYLKSGIFNSYWHNRIHEAKEKRELSWNDFYDLSDYQLKRELMPRYYQ
jgi:hypothetical protein